MITSKEYRQLLSFFIEDENEIEFLDEFRLLWKKFRTEIIALAYYPNKDTAMAIDIRKSLIEMCQENNFQSYYIVEPVFQIARTVKQYGKFVNREGIDIGKLIMI